MSSFFFVFLLITKHLDISNKKGMSLSVLERGKSY